MPDEYCICALCFVPLTDPSPAVFGLQQFVPGLALMAVAWTTADARYRFRVESAWLPVRKITFWVLAVVGTLTLLTSVWHAQHWLVPRGNILTPATWQALLGLVFIGTFMLWAWVAFVSPPIFSRKNANHYAQAVYHSVYRGKDLPEITYDLAASADALVRFATDADQRERRRARGEKPDEDDVPDVEVCANQVLLLMADRKVCRTIAVTPIAAIALFEAVARAKRFGVPVGIFGKNLVSEALKSIDSFLFTETEGYETGLLGFHKPLTQAMFSDFALVEGARHLLQLDWRQARDLSAEQWKAYSRILLVAFSAYVRTRAPELSSTIYGALQQLKQATSDFYKLDGLDSAWDQPVWEKLNVVVDFLRDAIEMLDPLGRPPGVIVRYRRVGSPRHDIYDVLANLMFEIVFDASKVKAPVDVAWSIQHNSVWADLFGFDHLKGPAGQIVKRKFMGQMYKEINELKRFPNFKGARCLAFCLNVMGLEVSQREIDRDSFPLHRAVLRWTKKNYALLHRRQSEVAERALAPEMSFDAAQMRIVKRHQHPLQQQPSYTYFSVDPPPASQSPPESA